MGSEVVRISVSDTETITNLSSTANYLVIKNSGSNTAYVNLDGTATTDSFPIFANETLEIGVRGVSAIHSICDTGLTTTLNVIAAGEL